MVRILKKILRKPRKAWRRWKNDAQGDNSFYQSPTFSNRKIDMVIVVGAESTATRFITKLLATHDHVLGEKNPESHDDLFDNIWQALEVSGVGEAAKIFPQKNEDQIFITRRSIPHSLFVDKSAKPFEFPALEEFIDLCKNKGLNPLVLVTVRSPLPNIMSWKMQRSSGKDTFKLALSQYQDVYPFIFHSIWVTNTPYFIVPQEALIVDREDFIDSLFHLIDLDPPKNAAYPEIKEGINSEYYQLFTKERSTLNA